jgi:YggT family protein
VTLLKDLIDILFYVFTLAIVIRAIASWFAIRRDNPLMVILYQVTEPILAPLRRIIPMMGMFDITPIVAIILLQVIRGLLYYLLSQF